MYGEPLQFPPGGPLYTKHADGNYYDDGTAYSNFGYMLLGLVVEAVSGQPFVDFLRQHVVADVFVSRTTAGGVWPNEIPGDEPDIGLTPFDYTSNLLTPAVCGGEDLVTELCDSGGGLMTNAQTLASFIHTHAVWTSLGAPLGGRAAGSARSGSEAGSSSLAVSRWDDVDWAFIFNTRWSVNDRIVGKDADGNDQSAIDKLGDDLGKVLDGVTWPSRLRVDGLRASRLGQRDR
jgi:CubicO group peptidase (beta-lactamase class C family)